MNWHIWGKVRMKMGSKQRKKKNRKNKYVEIKENVEKEVLEMEKTAEEAEEKAVEPAEGTVEEAAEEAAETAGEVAGEAEEVEEVEEAVEEAEEAPETPEEIAEKAIAETEAKTPAFTKFFYAVGIGFLAVSLFMLITAIAYMKTYLASYDVTFGAMWSNCIQYIIEHFVPYLAAGLISIGIGRAVKEFRSGGSTVVEVVTKSGEEVKAETEVAMAEAEAARAKAEAEAAKAKAEAGKAKPADEEPIEDKIKAAVGEVREDMAAKIVDLTKETKMIREIMAIKFEETEKRQKIRLEDSRQKIEDKLAGYFEPEIEEDSDEDFAGVSYKRERRFIK